MCFAWVSRDQSRFRSRNLGGRSVIAEQRRITMRCERTRMVIYHSRISCLRRKARPGYSDRFSSAPESLPSVGRWPADGRVMLLVLQGLEIVVLASNLFDRYRQYNRPTAFHVISVNVHRRI
jgi:hypothetical protein